MRNRPGEHARKRIRGAWRSAAAGNLRVLSVVALVALVFCSAEMFLPSPLWWRSYLLGFMTAAILGIAIWALDMLSGTRNLSLGVMGEQATAKAVLGRRRREGCQLVNGLYFAGHGDVDHLLVGPGGIFVLESKWTTVTWELSKVGVTGPPGRNPIAQAREGAHTVERMLRHGRERFDVEVHPVLVIWGPGAPVIEGGWTEIAGISVFEGRQTEKWLSRLERSPLSESLVDSLARTLETDLEQRVGRRP
jgi:Nuclease-related domain